MRVVLVVLEGASVTLGSILRVVVTGVGVAVGVVVVAVGAGVVIAVVAVVVIGIAVVAVIGSGISSSSIASAASRARLLNFIDKFGVSFFSLVDLVDAIMGNLLFVDDVIQFVCIFEGGFKGSIFFLGNFFKQSIWQTRDIGQSLHFFKGVLKSLFV